MEIWHFRIPRETTGKTVAIIGLPLCGLASAVELPLNVNKWNHHRGKTTYEFLLISGYVALIELDPWKSGISGYDGWTCTSGPNYSVVVHNAS